VLQQALAHDCPSSQSASAFVEDFALLQQASAQEVILTEEHASAGLVAQQESAEVRDTIEARDADGFFWREGRRDGGQQDSWPRASSARQMQPKASSLTLYCSRARRACWWHGLPFAPLIQSEGADALLPVRDPRLATV